MNSEYSSPSAFVKRIDVPAGDMIPLSSNEVCGRHPYIADIYCPDINVSRTHCIIYCKGNFWFIRDLMTCKGTYVNGVKVTYTTPFRLKNGCKIHLGNPEDDPNIYLFLN
ncbi:hypothetical protein CEXT_532421 [Caerostris extrusa]|uniref:FHA domain-containing protein n=1 Tax=Caerostris extrusa TaxID=172846 RepID=A0AAV4MTL3_CAEEX|nr:hypothetical protein CEXT_532421 [Caerostris extrusa]